MEKYNNVMSKAVVVDKDVNQLKTRYVGKTEVWKFGYGSNMSQEFLRRKKNLIPLDCRQCILQGFELFFPEGKGIDFVEPSFATTRRNPNGYIHGVATKFSIKDAESLNKQEAVGRAYNLEIAKVLLYDGKTYMDVEIYVQVKELEPNHPVGCCSERYRDILVNGAIEMKLDKKWIDKLSNLPTYTPSAETLARRSTLPPLKSLPTLSIDELSLHNGEADDLGKYPHYISSCGYIFQHKTFFKVYHGRDVTYRNVLHRRGINLDANDDGGVSPFPRLSELKTEELDYCLMYLDRFIYKSEGQKPIAILKEFWEEQDPELKGVYTDNYLSKLVKGN